MWAKWTALMAVPWKTKMACLMSMPGKPGCYCPITCWTSKEMFIAHWQIYHIDQHTSCILCKHMKDEISWHYMTDCEADMKSHIHRLHDPTIKEKQASNSYVNENAWLDLTSFWLIKDLERSYKTFPETCSGSSYKLIIWVIMNTVTEDQKIKQIILGCQLTNLRTGRK